MSSPESGPWTVLPSVLRSALVTALVVTLTSAGLLFRGESASELPSELTAPGDLAVPESRPGDLLVTPTGTPEPQTLRSRSSAVVSVPGDEDTEGGERRSRLPTFGTYVYDVQGSEAGPALSTRTLPPQMRMTVHRNESLSEPDAPPLGANELIFDLSFSADHEEREVVAYRPRGMTITHESRSVTFNTTTTSEEVSYDPHLLQIPAGLTEAASENGTSRAIAADGSLQRIEDWTVNVDAPEQITVLGEQVDTWIVTVSRTSQPGSSVSLTKTRRYWFDPARGIWVKWEESTRRTEGSGLRATSYTTDYTATLARVEPL